MMATTRRVSRAGSLVFVAALLAPCPAHSGTPAVPPELPPPAGAVVRVSNDSELQRAIANLRSYQTVVLAPGVYRLSSTLWINRALQQVVIRGATNNRDDVVLVGPGMTHASYGATPHGIWVGGVRGFLLANVTLRDFYQDALVFAPGTDKPVVYNVRFADVGKSFIETVADAAGQGVNDGLIQYSVFEFSSTTRDRDAIGVNIHGGAHWTIAGSLFRNIVASSYQLAGPAVLLSTSSSNALVEGNTFINCSRGVMFGRPDVDRGDHAGGAIRNNMFYRAAGQPGDTAIAVNGSPYTQVLNNSVFVSGTYATPIEYRYEASHDLLIANNLVDGSIWARDGATAVEAANLTGATPDLFADLSSGDLHLSASAAAAIDRGVPMPSVSTDWDGEARPAGRGWDIGADERAASVASTVGRFTTLASGNTPVFIGGRVTVPDPTGLTDGAGAAGVTVTLSGGRSLTVTTDATGIYLFSGVSLGSDYTITPAKSGVAFTPTTFVITGLNGTVTNANFKVWTPPVDSGSGDGSPSADQPPSDTTAPPSGTVFDPTPPDDPDPDETEPDDPEPPPSSDPGPGTPGPGPIATPPVVTITSPLNGSTYTSPATLTIAANASVSGSRISRVDFYVGSTKIASDSTFPYRAGWTNVSAGTYVLKAIAFSAAGASTESGTVTVDVIAPPPPPPADPPDVSVTSPTNGQTFTAPASMTLRASASTTNGSIVKVDFYAGSTLIATDTTSPYSRTWSNVAAGTYTVKAVATDSSGLTSTSGGVTIVVNPAAITPPTVSLTAPASGSAYTAPATITVSASASTGNGSITKVEFYAGTTLIGTDTTAPYSLTWNGAAAGSYAITAKATDSAGATKTSTAANITITPSLSAPSVSLTSPATGSLFTAPASVSISASASTASGTISKVDFYAGSTLIGSDSTAPYAMTWNNVAAGSYVLLAVATSSVGLTAQSAARSITVAAPATPPTVSLTAPTAGSTYTAPASILLSASATTSSGTITSVSFYSGSTLLGTDTSSPYTFSWSSVPAGSYSLTAVATNSAGLTKTSSAISVTVNQASSGGSGGGSGSGGSGGSDGGSSGGSSSSSGAVLDDFSQGLRTIPVMGALWSHYPEGASGSVSVSNGQLVDTVGGVTNSSGGGVYVQFVPKANDSYAFPGGYDQSHLVAGTWNPGFNRLTFRVKTDHAMGKPSSGGPNIEFGTYIRTHNTSDPNYQGAHYYHQMGIDFPANRWVYITINCVPQHQVGDNGTTNYPCNPTGDSYFDDLTRFYFDGIYGGGANATWTFDDFQFAAVGGEPDTLVASVSGTYDGSRYKLSWATPKNQSVTYTVYYSTVSMHANGLSAGTNGGTTSSTGNTYTNGPNWQSPSIAQPAGGMFFAIQPSGSSTFTEIYVPNN
jgi:hypothetical protein